MFEVIIFLFVALVAVVGAATSFVTLDPYEYGVHVRFGRPTGWIFGSGLHCIAPFGISRVERISTRLTDKIDFGKNNTFTMKSMLQLIQRGSVQYRPDPLITFNRELTVLRHRNAGRGLFGEEYLLSAPNTYFGIEEGLIENGIAEAVESKLGGIAGRYGESAVIQRRQPLTAYINALFRLKSPPHLNHEPVNCPGCMREQIRAAAATVEEDKKVRSFPAGEVGTDQILDFYEVHWKEVNEALDNERENDERSEIEWTYGIDIVIVALPVMDFTPETKRALEEAQQAKLRKGAVQTQGELIKELMDKDIPAQIAVNVVQMVLESEGTSRQILSVEGSSGSDALVAAAALVAGKKGGK